MATTDLTTGPIPKHLITLAAPVAGAMLLQSAYALVDLAFVARLGDTSVAALSISFQAFFIVLALSQAVATTAMAEISQLYGEGEIDRARRAFGAFAVVGAVLGAVSGTAAWLSADLYVGVFTNDPEVMALGVPFFQVTAITFLLQLLLIVFGNGLRASGNFTTPMKLMALSVITNMILDPLLIFGLGPFPALGVVGAAWATAIAQAITISVYVSMLLRRRGERDISLGRPAWSVDLFVRIATRGLPAGFQFFLISVVIGVVLAAMKPYGAAWTAVAGGGFRVLQQTFLPMVALGSAAAAISGQNLGAKHPARVSKTAVTALKWAAGYATVVSTLLFVFARTFGHLFASTEAELDVAEVYLHWSAPTTVAFAFTYIPTFVQQAAGRAVWPMVGAIARVVLLVGLVFGVIPALDLGPVWVFGAQTATALFEGLIGFVLLIIFLRKIKEPPAPAYS